MEEEKGREHYGNVITEESQQGTIMKLVSQRCETGQPSLHITKRKKHEGILLFGGGSNLL